ncbi:MAG: glutathione S-transferase family protein, partial [Deltaproteobacteria bacterium]|nr:glutathione S-transferase family protein [Deltaproteobacteria bacterium]
VELRKREQFSPEYMKISPGHKIPALVDDNGPGGTRVTLFESGAILKYLGEKSGTGLYPDDPVRRVVVDQWLFYGSATFTSHAQQLGLFRNRFGQDVPPARKHYEDQYRDMCGILDKRLADNAFLAGEEYSVADISCYPDVHVHESYGVPLDDWPNLRRWHDTIAARPAVQRAWGPF